MKATKLIVAAGLALATTGVFAETGVTTYQIDNVSNVYGRTGVAAVQIKGNAVQTTRADVNKSGRDTVKGATSLLVTTDLDTSAGRS